MTSTRTIHSGGATGADQVFGDIGTLLGYKVIHHTFKNHKVSGAGEKEFHTYEKSKEAFPRLEEAANKINQPLPSKNTDDYMLLIRDYYQVLNSEYIIAIAPFEDEKKQIVRKGTGWTVQLGIDMKKTVYLFDDGETDVWYKSEKGQNFELCIGEIPNTGTFAGIGSRTISDRGFVEIKKILMKDLVQENGRHYLKLKDVFSLVNDDLKFAEAKNSFLVPFCAANILWLFSNYNSAKIYSLGCYSTLVYFLYMMFPGIACIISIIGSMPNRSNFKHSKSLLDRNLLFWHDISFYDNQKYLTDFVRKYEIVELDLVKRIILVSKIAHRKYSLYWFASSIAVAGIIGTFFVSALTSLGYLERYGLMIFSVIFILMMIWFFIMVYILGYKKLIKRD